MVIEELSLCLVQLFGQDRFVQVVRGEASVSGFVYVHCCIDIEFPHQVDKESKAFC